MTGSAKEAQGGGKLYEIVRDELIEAIKSGAYAPGALLPSVREMTVRWTVSTTTARKVLSELVASGWARSQGTKGYVVTIPAQGEVTANAEGPVVIGGLHDGDLQIIQAGTGAGKTEALLRTAAILRSPQVVPVNGEIDAEATAPDVRTEAPPAEVALALRITEPRARVLVRRRLAVDATGNPVQLRVSYTAREAAEGTLLASSNTIDAPWLEALAEHTQKRLTLTESVISARHPTDSEGAMLALAPTACVLVKSEVTQDEEGQPIDCTVTIWPGDTTRIDALPLAGDK